MAGSRKLIGYGIVLNVLFLMTVRDLLASSAKASEDEEPDAKSLPPLKMMNKTPGGPVYRTALTERFPDMKLEGGNYDPDIWRVLLANALSYLKIAVIGLVASGFNPFNNFGVPTPRFYDWAISNKIYACLMSWFLTGMVENALMSTGAFEIYYNDLPVWSKLENGRLPEFQEVLSILTQQRSQAF